ncbi:MAG: hypothetical protein KGI33_12465 [Thaumarchaeota archaeon]|nr:hypothetical protein [Nitrososphaerota archaeon]
MKTLHFSIITIVAMTVSILVISPPLLQVASGSQPDDHALPLIDMQKIMSAAQNSTLFIEKADRYDHYLLARATMGPSEERPGNTTAEVYDLVYALYLNHGYCYFDHLLDVRLDAGLEVTNVTEYTLNDEPPGYPRPPVSCLLPGTPKIDYDRLLTILPPSPFASVNETFNASSDTIVFSGTVHKMFSRYILLEVYGPSGQRVAASQPMPEPDGTYSQAFHPYSPLWASSGNYLASITSGTHNLVESRFYFKGVGCCFTESPVYYTYRGLPPLEQWKEMYPIKDTACITGTQLVYRAEDHSPACIETNHVGPLYLRGWAALPVNGQIVYVIKPNTTGKILVNYTNLSPDIDAELNTIPYNGTTAGEIHTENLKVTANPDTVPHKESLVATYEITSRNDTGIYWLQLDSCAFIPIAISADQSQITSSDLHFPTSGLRCPVSFVEYKVVGVSNIAAAYKDD